MACVDLLHTLHFHLLWHFAIDNQDNNPNFQFYSLVVDAVEEVVVEKEVEKIVEKNIGEKIVYEKVEVPKEVVRKEMVYVPLPTDDENLLKKGPFKAPDYDKDKKK